MDWPTPTPPPPATHSPTAGPAQVTDTGWVPAAPNTWTLHAHSCETTAFAVRTVPLARTSPETSRGKAGTAIPPTPTLELAAMYTLPLEVVHCVVFHSPAPLPT